ncbi:MAG: NADH:flavin oxidoreductase [Kiritimatiellae bacterium]|nr:NADH:flavin oxidoreductase [Kiritimatiellia bacterium]
MPDLFDATSLNGLALKNRFVRSATWEGLADEDGRCSPALVACMRVLARGGVGLIISGHAYVGREGQASVRQLAVCDDAQIAGLSGMAGAVHAEGGKIVLQLAHAGGVAQADRTGFDAVGPSPMLRKGEPRCRAMTLAEIHGTAEAFGRAARRAREAGFDGVQLHAAHGYLLSQFLSPRTNQRTDEYGGSLTNRARLLLDALARIRQAAGPDFPLLIKINSDDEEPGGFTVDEMLVVVALLEQSGMNACELSGGNPSKKGPIDSPEQEAYFRAAAVRYKRTVHMPLILVGGIRSFEVAGALVRDGTADYVALCRPLIREPALIARWQAGDTKRAACISCNGCFKPGRKGEGVRCVVRED